ncbi:hypothetical protein ASPZODRAFT_149858 [Penicilliopsis zonata CBS 506.65]|uniref:Pre-rRNA-processing protein RIX1 n=1 Tax=Penicilliopsis zonata CBS 506.65 TaxID=1073090 RepID=A0A1L9SP38_9EURO|nr:hypothetical protein ASPZODRAFT_149858 [Penicilliopsis zonata CBS 506.65]OJJ48871.1 hypothetical protein ASPZODRAFT_149858 [Penicilliopsis zonata CBS 506.65]
MAATTTLRAITHRLTTTPVHELPQITSFLASSISDCGELFSTPPGQKGPKGDSDNAAQIQKLKTRLTSLSLDRTVEGRWTAVVLVKAAVEAGQWEFLRGCEPLVRNLISILGKPDPVSTRKMAVITLTRIFHLTYQYPTLVREITTPSLPSFITATLNLISIKPSAEPIRKLRSNTPFLDIVFPALIELVGRHPTIFRPFSAQIHSLVLAVIGGAPGSFPGHVVKLAERLFISLHNCAPKNTSGDEWKNAIKATIAATHRASDYVFRAVVEQWESADPALRQSTATQNYGQEVGDYASDALGLSSWHGLHAGAERLTGLLQLLSDFFSTPTASTVSVPLGLVLDLTARLTLVTIPSEGADTVGTQSNPQVGREERDALWAELPRIHTAVMGLLMRIVDLMQTSIVPVAQTILEQALWVFRSGKSNRAIRTAMYQLVQSLLPLIGPTMAKQNVSSLTNLFRACCSDILPPAEDANPSAASSADPKNKAKATQGTANADSFFHVDANKNRQSKLTSSFPELQLAATQLLPVILSFVPTEYLAPSLRAEIDRTIILVSDKPAMLASVLNPVPAIKGRGPGPSIIPFLARAHSAEMDVESLIRPRMPVLMSTPDLNGQVTIVEEEAEDEDGGEMDYAGVSATSGTTPTFITTTLKSQLSNMPSVAEQNSQSLAKRSLPQDTSVQSSALPQTTHVERNENVQTKKARHETEAPTFAAQTVVENTPSTSTTSVGTSRANQQPVATSAVTTNITTKPAVSMTAAAVPNAEDDSDDELPTLNIDSDTDDEDEDVNMEG